MPRKEKLRRSQQRTSDLREIKRLNHGHIWNRNNIVNFTTNSRQTVSHTTVEAEAQCEQYCSEALLRKHAVTHEILRVPQVKQKWNVLHHLMRVHKWNSASDLTKQTKVRSWYVRFRAVRERAADIKRRSGTKPTQRENHVTSQVDNHSLAHAHERYTPRAIHISTLRYPRNEGFLQILKRICKTESVFVNYKTMWRWMRYKNEENNS